MKPSSTIPLAVGAVLAGLGLWWLAGLGDVRSPEPPAATRSEPQPERSAPALEPARSAPETGRSPTDPLPPKPAPELPPETQGTIAGTVVDSGNRPLAGVEIAAVLGVVRDAEAYDPESKGGERTVARTRSDSDGRFALEVATVREHEVRASSPGFAVGVVAAVHAGEHPTILLRHGATLSGSAKRKEGGAAVAGARLFLVPGGGRSVAPIWEGRTDAKGEYLAENLPPGAHLLVVCPEKLAVAADRVTLAEGETRTFDISVPRGTILLGEVKDAVTGLPIAGAEVSPYDFRLLTVRTDEAGRYEVAGSETESSTITVWARAPGFGVYEVAAEPREGGVVEADFALARSCSAVGRVVAREGGPIPEATVVAWASRKDGAIVRTDRKTARTGSDGRFRLPDLRTDLPHAIVVRRERYAESVAKTIEAGNGGEIDLGDVVLAPGASLEGTVSTPDGDPVQAADVTFAPADCGAFEHCPLERYASTDAKGVFRFADLAAGTFRIDVEAEGIPARKEGWRVTLAEGEAKRGFRIVVGEGRSISGRVVDARGLGVEDAEIELFVPDSTTSTNLRSRSKADGSFQVNGVSAGADYDVEARFREVYGPPDDRHHLIDARAARVAAGTSDLVLELRRAAEIVGRVTGIVAEPEAHPFLLAVDGEGRRLAGMPLDGFGRFLLRVPAGEFVELRVWADAPESIARGPVASDPDHPPQVVRAGVRGGDSDVVLVLKP